MEHLRTNHNYTMVTALINEEYASIREEETGESVKTAHETAHETAQERLARELETKIIDIIKENQRVNRRILAAQLRVSEDVVK